MRSLHAAANAACIAGVGECDDDPEHDVELKQCREPSAPLGGCDLGDVHRCRDRTDADAEAADESCGDEEGDVRGERAADRRGEEQDADGEQGGPAAEAIGGPGTEQRAQHRAVQSGTHCDAMHAGAQIPQALNRLLGARDHDGIEAEQEAGERGGEGIVEQVTVADIAGDHCSGCCVCGVFHWGPT